MDSSKEELQELIEKIALDRKQEIKESSKEKYLQIAALFQPFTLLTKELIDEQLLGKSPYTHNLYVVVLKYLAKFGYIPGDIISHLRRKRTENKYKSKKQLLTREELQKLIEVTKQLEMKALYSLLYETGARRGELLAIKRSDIYTIKKQDHSIEWNVFLTGKTGSREIPIIECLSYLLPYLSHRGDFEGQLWQTSPENVVLKNDALAKRLKMDRRRAGIKKNITLHTFRHSRATELAAKLPANILMVFFGWKSPAIVQTYVHLSGSDLRSTLNEYYGLTTHEEKIIITNCPVCKIPISTDLDQCPQCNHSFIRRFKNPNESSREKLISLLSDPEIATQIITILEYGLDRLEKLEEETKENEEN